MGGERVRGVWVCDLWWEGVSGVVGCGSSHSLSSLAYRDAVIRRRSCLVELEILACAMAASVALRVFSGGGVGPSLWVGQEGE